MVKEQLNNAIVLLEKGYGIWDEVEPIIEKYGNLESVPEKRTEDASLSISKENNKQDNIAYTDIDSKDFPYPITNIQVQDLLPKHYVPVVEPSFTGRGNHSVLQLEDIIESYKELVHQLRIREQSILRIVDAQIIQCEGNCGMNYCDENGCLDRKR